MAPLRAPQRLRGGLNSGRRRLLRRWGAGRQGLQPAAVAGPQLPWPSPEWRHGAFAGGLRGAQGLGRTGTEAACGGEAECGAED